MLEVSILAVALSMDAFAVSISLGAKQTSAPFRTAWLCALYFGLFQGLMPLIGFFAGQHITAYVGGYANYIAASLLFLIGFKMIKEAMDDDPAKDVSLLSHRVMLILAIATSIDALAAGFALIVFDMSIWLAAIIITLITAAFSAIGTWVGHLGATWLESKAEWLGGLVLITLGIKVLVA